MATASPDLISRVIPFSISSSVPAIGTRFRRFSTLIIGFILSRNVRTALVLGLLCLGLAGHVQARAQSILVLGDSISAAYGMSLEQGWVALLEQQLARREPPWQVINASISGETTGGGLRRLPGLLERHQPGIVIIELGGNDGLRGFPLDALQDNLRQLVSLAQAAGAEVIVVPMEIPPNYGSRYTDGFRASFVAVAQDTDSTLAPFLLDGVATQPGLMQADGIHPAVAAQPLLLENILPAVQAVLAD
ncbi:MAG: arylesterase [Pseudomonadales bacterium]|nr:arylesterase [Pseudomonadales bacterium]